MIRFQDLSGQLQADSDKRAPALAERLTQTRAITSAPIGVNVFVPGSPAAPGIADAYAATLNADAADAGVGLGVPRFDDDDWTAKIDLLAGGHRGWCRSRSAARTRR